MMMRDGFLALRVANHGCLMPAADCTSPTSMPLLTALPSKVLDSNVFFIDVINSIAAFSKTGFFLFENVSQNILYIQK